MENIFVGAPVFVKDPELGQVYGEIFWINKSEVYIHTANGKTVVSKLSEVSPKDFSHTAEYSESSEEPPIIQEAQLKIQGRNIEEQITAILTQEKMESSKQKKFITRTCKSQNLGFSDGIPLTARVIHKCLLKWGSFESEKTSIFHQISNEISLQITQSQDSTDQLAYWLSNLNTLLIQIIGVAKEIKIKFPATKFRQYLVVHLNSTYEKIRYNIKKELTHEISHSMKEPRKSQEITVVGSSSTQTNDDSAEEMLSKRLQNITKIMDSFLETVKSNHVSQFLAGKLFNQLFAFINFQLFNSVLSNLECCSFIYGKYVKSCLKELEIWCYDAKEYVGSSREELKHTKQAVELLLLEDKPNATFMNINRDLCPDLNLQQLHRLCNMYNDDKYPTNNFSSDVLASLPQNYAADSYLLPDEDDSWSSIPFSLADISKTMGTFHQIDFDLAAFIRNNPNLL